jgi:hypothetical protein
VNIKSDSKFYNIMNRIISILMISTFCAHSLKAQTDNVQDSNIEASTIEETSGNDFTFTENGFTNITPIDSSTSNSFDTDLMNSLNNMSSSDNTSTTTTDNSGMFDMDLMNALNNISPDDTSSTETNTNSPSSENNDNTITTTDNNKVLNTITESEFLKPIEEEEGLMRTLQKTNHEFFQITGITSEDVKNIYPNNSEEFVQFTSEEVLNRTYKLGDQEKTSSFTVTGVKAGDWCFITFTDTKADIKERATWEFFTSCVELMLKDNEQKEDIYFREVNESCPKPPLNTEDPLPVKKCKWYYQETKAFYDFAVEIQGFDKSKDMMECICRAVLTLKNQPNIALMCMEEAVVDNNWQSMTKDQYESWVNDIEKTWLPEENKFLVEAEKNIIYEVKGKTLESAIQQVTENANSINSGA